MKKIIYLLLLLIPVLSISQEEIGRKVYLYGDIEGELKGKLAVRFNFMDMKIERFALEYLSEKGADVIAWNSVFLPSVEYSMDEVKAVFDSLDVYKLVLLNLEGVEESKHTTWYTYGDDNQYVTSSEEDQIDKITYRLEVIDINKDPKKPNCVVIANAKGGSDLSSVKSVSKKIIRRLIDGIEEEGAFR